MTDVSHTCRMNILWILLPLTGTWAKDPPKDIYGLDGGSICVAVADIKDVKELRWKLNEHIMVRKNTTAPKYDGKIVYYHFNYTLCIKNLRENDSGLYSASYEKDWTESTTEYKLTVQKAVPVPTMLVTFSNSSTGLCNITVNCSGWELTVCHGNSCIQSQTQAHSDANMSISRTDGFIHCTVNNYVSRNMVSKSIKDIPCINEMYRTSTSQLVPLWFWLICGPMLVVVLLGIGCWTWKYTKKKKLKRNPGRVSPEGSPVPQPSTDSEVTSIYVTAGKPRATEKPSGSSHPVDRDCPEPNSSPQVDALSTVQQPVLNNPPVSKCDPPRVRPVPPRRPPEAGSTSIYSNVEKPAQAHRHPVDKHGNNLSLPDTVYSTLGKLPLPPTQ